MMSEQTIGDEIAKQAEKAAEFYRRIKGGETVLSDPAMAFWDLENEIYIATEALEMAKEMVK